MSWIWITRLCVSTPERRGGGAPVQVAGLEAVGEDAVLVLLRNADTIQLRHRGRPYGGGGVVRPRADGQCSLHGFASTHSKTLRRPARQDLHVPRLRSRLQHRNVITEGGRPLHRGSHEHHADRATLAVHTAESHSSA